MSVQMTPTAWDQGLKNASLCGVVVVVLWCLLAAAVMVLFERPIAQSFNMALTLVSGLSMLLFLGIWFQGRCTRGAAVLDCGPQPARSLLLTTAAIFLLIGLIDGSDWMLGLLRGLEGDPLFEVFARGGLILLFVTFQFLVAIGRLQIRENGLWQYHSLLRWDRISSYHWAKDGTLLVRERGFPYLFRGALPVPAEHRQAVEELLRKYCMAPEAA